MDTMTKKAIFIEGKSVFLSPLDVNDKLENYAHWLNDRETTLYLYGGNFPQSLDSLRRYIDDHNKSKDSMLLGIFAKDTSEHIGNITLQRIDPKNRWAEIGIILGDKNSRGKGYAGEALRLVVEHAFNSLNLRRLFADIVEGNDASVRIFEKLGFKLEGTYREHFYHNDKYYDCLFYGLLKKEYAGKAGK